MDITAFIRELLFSHDCVIVPGFGGFIGNYRPAVIDGETSTFHPPLKQITFNRNLNHNDGLLIKQISGTSGINYGDSRNMVEEFVAATRKKLERGERVVFDHIGTFKLNGEGSIEFEPDNTVNYHLDSYGLESFQCFPYGRHDSVKRLTAVTPVKHSSLRKYLWRAAVLVPLAGIIFAVSLKTDFFKSKIEAGSLNPLVTAEFEHNKAALDSNIINPGKTSPVTESEQSPAAVPEETDAVTAESPAGSSLVSESTYMIITGSFQSEENAGRQVSRLQSEGFNPRVVEGTNGFYRVCAMTCPDLETAIQKKDSIVKIFPGAWISRKK